MEQLAALAALAVWLHSETLYSIIRRNLNYNRILGRKNIKRHILLDENIVKSILISK